MSDRVRAVYYAMAPVTVILLIVWRHVGQRVPAPALARASGRGYPELFSKAETWVQDQVFALVDPIKRLGGK